MKQSLPDPVTPGSRRRAPLPRAREGTRAVFEGHGSPALTIRATGNKRRLGLVHWGIREIYVRNGSSNLKTSVQCSSHRQSPHNLPRGGEGTGMPGWAGAPSSDPSLRRFHCVLLQERLGAFFMKPSPRTFLKHIQPTKVQSRAERLCSFGCRHFCNIKNGLKSRHAP